MYTYKDYLDIWESHFDDNDEGEYSHRWVKKLSKEQFEIQRYQFERIQNRIEEIQSRKDYGPKLSLKIKQEEDYLFKRLSDHEITLLL